MSFKVLFLKEMDVSGKNILRDAGGEVIVTKAHDEAGWIKEISEYQVDALLTRTDNVTPAMMDASKNLKVIAKHGVGLDCIDMDYATQKGIQVVFAPQGNSNSVAEHTMMLLLMCAVRFKYVDNELRSGNFNVRYTLHNTYELQGMTLGLLGCGRIGQMVAEKAVKGFGMKVIGYDPFFPKAPIVPIEQVSQQEVFEKADFISMHMPSMPSTRGSIGKDLFKLMKPTASFINCARGDVVVEEDLIEALQKGTMLGAGLDVFNREPLPMDDPLMTLPNVILTPHTAASTEQATVRCCSTACQGIADVLAGKTPQFPANFKNGR